MTDFDNTNRGALFKNDDKQSDKHADYRGSLNVGGVEFWLDAWLKTSKKGTKFMSLSVKPKQAKPSPPPRHEVPPAEEFDDDLPF